jgi:hypothetical protein
MLLGAFKAGARLRVEGRFGPKLLDVPRSALQREVHVSPPLASEMLASLTRSRRTGSYARTDRTRARDSQTDRHRHDKPGDRPARISLREDVQALCHEHSSKVTGSQAGRGRARCFPARASDTRPERLTPFPHRVEPGQRRSPHGPQSCHVQHRMRNLPRRRQRRHHAPAVQRLIADAEHAGMARWLRVFGWIGIVQA